MTRKVVLREIAHARAGDKGDTSNVAVFVYDPAHYPALKAQLTAGRIEAELAGVVKGTVTRYAVDPLHVLNFVLTDALEGGVNASLNLDGHGKSWSYLFLALEVEVP
jgi:hypothetical protein